MDCFLDPVLECIHVSPGLSTGTVALYCVCVCTYLGAEGARPLRFGAPRPRMPIPDPWPPRPSSGIAPRPRPGAGCGGGGSTPFNNDNSIICCCRISSPNSCSTNKTAIPSLQPTVAKLDSAYKSSLKKPKDFLGLFSASRTNYKQSPFVWRCNRKRKDRSKEFLSKVRGR